MRDYYCKTPGCGNMCSLSRPELPGPCSACGGEMEEDLDRILNDKTVNPHWDKPGKCTVRILTALGQLWVSRRSLVRFLDGEITVIRANHVPGINEYWDDTQVEYLEMLKTNLLGLSAETDDEEA